MINSMGRNGAMLAAFAVVTTGLIAVTFFGTQSRIQHQQQQRLLSVLNEVVPASLYNNTLYEDCTLVTASAFGNDNPHRVYRARLDGEPVALALETTAPNGYSGNIELVVGVSQVMQVLGVRAVEHKETPGLGDKIELTVSDWITRFSGKTYDSHQADSWKVKKDGGQFDQFTGATITPRAVVGAVAKTLAFVESNQEALFAAPGNCATGNDPNGENP